MIEPKSVKERSVGRPKTNKALQKLRVQTWFNAVAEASGKTAYELEKEFAPSTVDREDFNKQRARLWEKYRLGKTMPTIKDKKGGKKGIALQVEQRYPGTLKWLTNELGHLADMHTSISMEFLREVCERLPPEIKKSIIKSDANSKTLFWRKKEAKTQDFYEFLAYNKSPFAFIGLLALFRESIVCQDEDAFLAITRLLIEIEDKGINHGPILSSRFIRIILTPALTIY